MEGDDPWYWDIERVVTELCTESRSWTADTVRLRRRPDFETLEAALREQEIDGSTLLTAVDDTVLKNELGIKILGQLAPVKQIIWDLRQESPRYRDWLGRYGSEISLASHIPYNLNTASNIRKRSESPLLRDTALHITSHIWPNREHAGENDVGISLKNESAGQRDAIHFHGLGMDAWVADAAGRKRRRLNTEVDHNFSILHEIHNLQSNPEVYSVDRQPVSENGVAQVDDDTTKAMPTTNDTLPVAAPVLTKQRKRIAPTLIAAEIDMDRNRAIPTEADMVIDNDPQNIEPGVIYVGEDGKKRLIPISQSEPDLDLPRRHQEQLRNQALADRSALQEGGKRALEAAEQILETAKEGESLACGEALSMGYLGKKSHSVNDIFYSNTAIGKELSSVEDKDGGLMLMTQGTVSDGRRLYVHGLMKRFLRSERQTICRNGKYLSALRPYPTRLAPMHQPPSFTLLRKDDNGKIHATREVLSKWPELDPHASIDTANFQDYDDRQTNFDLPDNLLLGGPSSYNNWDPDLLEKYRYIDGGDHVLPLYGESDEEGEYDRETWKEIEEERGTLEKPLLPLKRTQLTRSEINAGIDEGMAQIVVTWHKKKLPKLQRHAWSLWKKSRRKGEKRELIRKATEHINRINNERLPQMRDEFLRDTWVSKKQVLRVTKIMESTIFDREDRLWQLSVIKSEDEPERSPREPKPIALKLSVTVDDGDGESIMTETETQSSNNEDFIDDAADSAREAEHTRADDEAEDLATSDEDNSDHPQGGDKSPTPSKAPRIPMRTPFQKTLGTEQIRESNDKHMIGMSPPVDEDEIVDPLQTDTSISPPLPLRLASDDHGVAQAYTSTASSKRVNDSQEVTDDIIDLTILSSDTSGGERSRRGSHIIDLVTPQKRKNNIRPTFKREASDAYESSDVFEVSRDEATDVPQGYLTLTDPAAIAKIPREKWEAAGDKDRLLIGELFRITPERKKELFELFAQLTIAQMWSRMIEVMHAFRDGKVRVRGMDPKTYNSLTGVMRLFEMYAVGKYRRTRKKLEPTEVEMISREKELFPQFHQLCRKTWDHLLSNSKNKEASDGEDEDPLPAARRKFRASSGSASDAPDFEQDIPHKTRKKKIFENAQARDLREQDRQRLLEQEERRRILQDKLGRFESGVTADRRRIIINDAKHEDQGFVYVHEQISKRIKEHQIDGVRFMWSQIVIDEDVMQGCLLAHTMGLGKTMQVITLLVAIAEAAQSPDLSISSQIPLSLRISKTLVLCPPTLLDNWMDELLMWAPPGILGEYRKFDSTLKTKEVRLNFIESWYANGGILIMSYEMFRKLVQNNATEKQKAPLDEGEHAQVCKHLLEGPNLIVADEAHKMKNANASITQAAIKFRSSSRIALTGSPLANNVEEYHTMIEWIAPNYLGPITEFRAKYVEPIQQGLWSESTAFERRQSLKMLGVLREDLSPKVHRADISVLRKDLKPKTEFVITVPLTDLQHKAYSIYVRSMLGNDHEVTKDGQVQLSTLWHWLAILSLLCNHPACFKAKLSERKDDAEKKAQRKSRPELATHKASASEDDDGTGDAPIWKVGVSEELIRQEMALFKQFGSAVEDFHSSNKVKLLLQILDASRAVGDRVLIFSHSIQTLNFLEGLCRSTSRKYARLDGSTKMNSRQRLTKDFNTGSTELYLISTTAGGIGLNLPGANRVIIFDFRFNPVNEEQAIGRAYRIGQQKPVFVYRFVAGGTFEESIHNKAVFKMQLASRVVDKKNPVAWAKKRFGDFLFEPRVVKQQDLSGFKAMDPFVLDKVLGRQEQDLTIRAIVMTDTFERHDHEVLTAEEQKEVMQLLSDEKLKRSNKPAWDAEVRKRALASRPQHSIQQQPPTGNILPTSQAAYNQGQHVNGSSPALRHPPILPASSLPPRPSNKLKPQNTLNPAIPEMIPIAGVNTKIRDLTPPPNNSYSHKGTKSLLDPLINIPGSGISKVIHEYEDSSSLHGPTSNVSPIFSMQGVTVNGGAVIQDKQPPGHVSLERSKKVHPRTPPAPDHKRSLSGDQEGSDAADRLLRVAIIQYSQTANSVLSSKGAVSEKVFDTLAVSIRKEIERSDPKRLKERTEEIISLLSRSRELADTLVSGKLTAGAIVAMPFTKSANVTNGANGPGLLGDGSRPKVSIHRRQKLIQIFFNALQSTLLTKRSGSPMSRRNVETVAADLVKALAETAKDGETFEIIADAALIETTNHQTCLRLVNGAIKAKDFAKSLTAQSTKPEALTMDGSSDSPKSPHLPISQGTSPIYNSINSRKGTRRSPQSRTDLAYYEMIAARCPPRKLPHWALSDIEKAKTGSSVHRGLRDVTPHTPSYKQHPMTDLT